MGSIEDNQSRLAYNENSSQRENRNQPNICKQHENWEHLILRLSAGTIQVDRLIEIVIADIAYKSKTRTEARMAAVAKKQAMEESA